MSQRTTSSWGEWLQALDEAGATAWDHKGIVAHLERTDPPVVSSWWRQSIVVEYERARGKRVVGATTGAGFEVGAQRTVAVPAASV